MKNLIFAFIGCCFALLGCKEKPESRQDKLELVQTGEPKNVQNPTPTLKIIPIEHATVVLEWGGTTLYIDPVGGAAAFEGQKTPDLILITDIHEDHFSVETLLELNTSKAKIMLPQAAADKMPEEFTPQIDVLHNRDRKERYGIEVEAIPMYNIREEALKYHTKGRGNGYVLDRNGQRIYISGDTEDTSEMRSLKNIDIAFVCMNLPYTMTVENAADAVLDFKPQQVYPYHYRGRPEVSDVKKFKELVNQGNQEIEVVLLDWYPAEDF
ncbi:MAG: MBL fold metallo-hydrolase [Bacteroidota bacterium]